MQTLLQHKLTLVVIALLVAGGVWYGMSSTPAVPDLTSTPAAAGASSADQGIVPTLLTLRAVKLDGTIFSNPTFTQLRDFSTDIITEPVGRTNPFAPFSSPSQLSASSTKGTQTFQPRGQ